jgi:hypothetical protein
MSANVGLQLFPPPPSKKMSRVLSTRRPTNPQSPPISAVERASSPELPDGRQSALSGRQSAMEGRASAIGNYIPPNSIASPIAQLAELPRSYTSLSDAPTLVRSQSIASHSSIAKPKIYSYSPSSGSSSAEPMIHSIFPRYNPALPLEQQPYYPTQASPTHIPRTVISKAPYSPGLEDRMRSPLSAPPTVGRFPSGIQDVPVVRKPSTTEELKELWKVTNGWRVSASEGRSFCLKMTSAIEVPVHTLSSDTQPFYTLRLDPTSTSAILTLTRHDPNKSVRGSISPKAIGKSAAGTEALSTTLEESARHLPPNDGLVALLYPRAAANMVIDLMSKPNGPGSEAITEAAEMECGRLVWDEDSKKYYLVHPAMATPFGILISSSPAWSRVEYTLEHPELPQNLVKLIRDGSGGGFLEVDTGVAARIDCFYIVDVAICAILLVAVTEEKAKNIERFDAPPTSVSVPNTPKGKKPVKVEEMEVDLESQSSLADKKGKSNLPAPTRGALGLLFLAFKFVVWLLTVAVNAAASLIIFISGCLTKA